MADNKVRTQDATRRSGTSLAMATTLAEVIKVEKAMRIDSNYIVLVGLYIGSSYHLPL